jgi:ubiquinone/menaquinone biosynthesis C-methylase UbiE
MNILLAQIRDRIVSMETPIPVTDSREQFDKQADLYAVSTVHRHGPSLPILVEYAAPLPSDRVLDVATGTGNAAFTLAPHVAEVVGLDVSERMLEQAQTRANDEQIGNIHFKVGDAERIPFEEGRFSMVISRHAPHHFRNADRFVQEVRRVLTSNGRFILADQISTTKKVQPWNEVWQRTRDTSHFCQRTVEEWQAIAHAAGFRWIRHSLVGYRMEFAWWVRQAGVSESDIARLREHARSASEEVRESARLEFDGDDVVAFTDQMMVARMEPIAS